MASFAGQLFARIGDEFDGGQQTFAADFSKMAVPGKGFVQTLEEMRTGCRCICRQVLFFDEVEVGDGCCGADWMGGVGPAVVEDTKLVGAFFDGLPDPVSDDAAGQRQIGAGEAFGDTDQIGLHVVML